MKLIGISGPLYGGYPMLFRGIPRQTPGSPAAGNFTLLEWDEDHKQRAEIEMLENCTWRHFHVGAWAVMRS